MRMIAFSLLPPASRGPSPEQVAAGMLRDVSFAAPDVSDNGVRQGLARFLLQANMARLGVHQVYRCVATTAAVALPLLAGCAPAYATPEPGETPVCMGRDQAVAVLEKRHGETRRATLLSNDGTILEIFANGTSTWTVLRTAPSGLSCVLEVGEGFFDAPATTPTTPTPAKPAEWEA